MVVGVSYNGNIEEAEAVIRDCIRQQICLSAPEAIVGVASHSDFGPNTFAVVWVQSDLMVSGKIHLLREIIKSAFDKGEINIPFLRYEVEHPST